MNSIETETTYGSVRGTREKGVNIFKGILSGSRPERFIASRTMAELWANFARTGKPSAVGAPEWPAYNLDNRPSMRIDTKCEVIYNRYREGLALWRSI
jgi:para-nitrobenzyl esterase